MSTILEYSHVTKQFGSMYALSDVSLTIEPGHIIGLLGPNGSGKTTLIKLACGLLVPSSGVLSVCGGPVGPESKARISYLPDKNYLSEWMKVSQMIDLFHDFYDNFDRNKAYEMLKRLNINPGQKFKTLSKGTREKVQLILVMSRNADLYLLDEPIGGVDPAARDYILQTILTNYNENGSILISTHLISDVEQVLDQIIFLKNGVVTLQSSVDGIREQYGKSVDELFREVFQC
ncbi:MAG: ABC transporter ATP-binding protein [Hungatella sp.]|mgnify:FL=1|jgi:ABC-2 type transport system ATP-binding protein|nr:ABC transporter ATP-binding protein [Hungatella sp.]